MNPVEPSLPAVRVAPDARTLLNGVWHLTSRRWLVAKPLLIAGGLIAALAALAYSATVRGDAADFRDWIGGFYIHVAVPILAFLSGAGAMRDDLKPEMSDYLFTRPVSRPLYVVFRYLSQLVCLEAVYLPVVFALAAVGLAKQIPGLGPMMLHLALAQVLALAVFSALGFVCAAVTERYLITGLAYVGVVEFGLGRIETPIGRLSITRRIEELFATTPWGEMLGSTLVLLVIGALFVAAAAAVFLRREFTGAAAKD